MRLTVHASDEDRQALLLAARALKRLLRHLCVISTVMQVTTTVKDEHGVYGVFLHRHAMHIPCLLASD
jgi:hypothetical protein